MSSFPITNAKILVHMWGDDNDEHYDLANATSERDFYQAIVVGALAPGEAVRGKLVVSNPDAAIGLWGTERVANPDFTFTDAWGVNWLRKGTTNNRLVTEDIREDMPQCMCCGDLPEAPRASRT
ncbi:MULTISPECIES: hypothetical protein [Microbacterium]|uniref:hypothetical protein n=1 Tax=Microbacterium TaxID=33882 RepID=UPI00217D9F98|nr:MULTISPECIES: hypothetical protein [Microbacterium]UWF78020.1 hypothetical protein JSY13_02960 [Microbacterium neungamense]WCM56198.1 hypothetical protein JRG78_02985 [Microbacterium sp. EF45047]